MGPRQIRRVPLGALQHRNSIDRRRLEITFQDLNTFDLVSTLNSLDCRRRRTWEVSVILDSYKQENAIYKFDPANGDWRKFILSGVGWQEAGH
jgi:hypothetical protein